MHIAILYNRLSAKGKARKMALSLHALYGQEATLFENEWPDALEAYEEIWLVGGDGTVNFFINRYPRLDRPVMLFPGGTGNDIHWKLYGDMTWEQQFERRASFITEEIDIGRCNGQRFMNGVGVGFDGEVLKSMDAIRRIGGHLGYLLVVIRQIFSFREPEFQIELDGQTIRRRCMLLSVANSSRTGGGFLVSPLADVQDGWLNLIYCDPISVWQRLLVLPKVEKGAHLTHPAVHHQCIQAIHIQASTTVFAQLDGELISSDRFDIHLAKERIQVKCCIAERKSAI